MNEDSLPMAQLAQIIQSQGINIIAKVNHEDKPQWTRTRLSIKPFAWLPPYQTITIVGRWNSWQFITVFIPIWCLRHFYQSFLGIRNHSSSQPGESLCDIRRPGVIPQFPSFHHLDTLREPNSLPIFPEGHKTTTKRKLIFTVRHSLIAYQRVRVLRSHNEHNTQSGHPAFNEYLKGTTKSHEQEDITKYSN